MTSLVTRAKNKGKRIVFRKTARLRSSLRVGIVGYGLIAPEHVDGYENSGMAHVVAVNDVSSLSASQAMNRFSFVKAYKDLTQMLNQERPDIVSVCTWPQSHAAIVEQLAAAGVKGI